MRGDYCAWRGKLPYACNTQLVHAASTVYARVSTTHDPNELGRRWCACHSHDEVRKDQEHAEKIASTSNGPTPSSKHYEIAAQRVGETDGEG